MRGRKVGILGAAGAVGNELVHVLEERGFPVAELRLLATQRSAGKRMAFRGDELVVEAVREELLSSLDLLFIAAGTEASATWAPRAVASGAVVIDKSNAFRMDPSVPLVVPEVNRKAVRDHRGIIASPNCSTIQMVVAIEPIRRRVGIERIIVATYQAVSGTGLDAIEELRLQTGEVLEGRPAVPQVYPRPIAFNVLPHIDGFGEDGFTLEERKLVLETRKILASPDLPITATAVRVPVFVGHAEAVIVQTRRPATVAEVKSWLREAPGVVLYEGEGPASYPTPLDAAGRDEVLVGRVRADSALEWGINLWVVADNLRKGVATNAVQIATLMLEEGMI